MIRFPHNKLSNLRAPSYREQETNLVEARVNGGMVTTIDSSDIENNQFVSLKNVHVRFDKTSRRLGTTLYTPAKPDNNKILAFTAYERFDGGNTFVRITNTSVHLGYSTFWNPVAGVLTGGLDDRLNTVVANDRFFFTNGVDYIQELDSIALTFGRLGNASRYKFLTSFNNRLVAAYETGIANNPIKIAWSGNLNFGEWNALNDPSAGFQILIDSPTDFADDIAGLFGFEDVTLILRNRSLWAMSKQPSPTNPFGFNVITSSVGCDAPYSAVAVKNGIAWFDFRAGTAYVYTIGMQEPQAIGRPIEATLLNDVYDSELIFGGYNSVNDEYIIAIPNLTTTITKLWTFNFRTQAWWYDEIDNVSAIANIDYSKSSLVINELVGTIDQLVGTIDSLGNEAQIATRFYGLENGDILKHTALTDSDNSVPYTTQLISKTFTVPKHVGYVTKLLVEYTPQVAGNFSVYYSKDGGFTWKFYKTVTWTNGDSGRRKLATFRKHLKCPQYSWKLESSSGLFDIIGFEISAVVSQEETRQR